MHWPFSRLHYNRQKVDTAEASDEMKEHFWILADPLPLASTTPQAAPLFSSSLPQQAAELDSSHPAAQSVASFPPRAPPATPACAASSVRPPMSASVTVAAAAADLSRLGITEAMIDTAGEAAWAALLASQGPPVGLGENSS